MSCLFVCVHSVAGRSVCVQDLWPVLLQRTQPAASRHLPVCGHRLGLRYNSQVPFLFPLSPPKVGHLNMGVYGDSLAFGASLMWPVWPRTAFFDTFALTSFQPEVGVGSNQTTSTHGEVVLVLATGAERFSANIRDMTGFSPLPVFKLCWKYLTPAVCTVSDHLLLTCFHTV